MDSTQRATQCPTLQTMVFTAALLRPHLPPPRPAGRSALTAAPSLPCPGSMNTAPSPSIRHREPGGGALCSPFRQGGSGYEPGAGTRAATALTVDSHLLQGASGDSAQVDYEVLVPAGAVVFIHSNSGTLSAEHLTGDVSVEGAAPRSTCGG